MLSTVTTQHISVTHSWVCFALFSTAQSSACWGTTAATRVPRLRIGECPREVTQEGSTG